MFYIILKLFRKKKFPIFYLSLNAAVIVLFFLVRSKVANHLLIFYGDYTDSPEYWEEGMANLMITLINEAILFIVFAFVQLIFWIKFKDAFQKLNKKP